jgi:uncharacterized protein (DUF305 family)
LGEQDISDDRERIVRRQRIPATIKAVAGTRYPNLVSTLSAGLRLAAALMTAVFLVACSHHDAVSAATSTTDRPLVTDAPAGNNDADLAFVDDMLALHQQGLDISALVAQQSARPDVIDFATKSAGDLHTDMGILRPFRVQWIEATHTETSDKGPTNSTSDLLDDATVGRLHTLTGAEFDTLSLQSMLQLSRAEVQLANTEIVSGKNPDAITLAKQIVATQQAAIDEINQLMSA